MKRSKLLKKISSANTKVLKAEHRGEKLSLAIYNLHKTQCKIALLDLETNKKHKT